MDLEGENPIKPDHVAFHGLRGFNAHLCLWTHAHGQVSCKTTSSKMNAFVAVLAGLVASANAGVIAPAPLVGGKTLVRAPAHDSASIANHRLGGNFAYAAQTAEAFAEVTPKIAHQTIPVAEHAHVHQPAAIRTIQPAPIVTKTFSASPVLAQKPVFGTEPVIGPVATEVTYKQPIYKT